MSEDATESTDDLRATRQPWEWAESDLLSLIKNEVKESIELDYKQCDALANTEGKKNELSKDVSALANSAGGVLLYGMIEDKHVPTEIDVGFDRESITKEWHDQVINSRIQRKIEGVRINQVELPSKGLGRVAYVVHVPQSDRAPHQAADKKFYKRHNFASVPMEEYEIRDVSHRHESPNLTLDLNIVVSRGEAYDTQNGLSLVLLTPIVRNEAPTPAKYIVINLFIDKRLPISTTAGRLQFEPDCERILGGKKVPCQFLNLNWSVASHMPVFPGADFQIVPNPVRLKVREPGEFWIEWELLSPKMSPRSKAQLFKWDGTVDENRTIAL